MCFPELNSCLGQSDDHLLSHSRFGDTIVVSWDAHSDLAQPYDPQKLVPAKVSMKMALLLLWPDLMCTKLKKAPSGMPLDSNVTSSRDRLCGLIESLEQWKRFERRFDVTTTWIKYRNGREFPMSWLSWIANWKQNVRDLHFLIPSPEMAKHATQFHATTTPSSTRLSALLRVSSSHQHDQVS